MCTASALLILVFNLIIIFITVLIPTCTYMLRYRTCFSFFSIYISGYLDDFVLKFQAGIPSDNLNLALKPESAAIYCKELSQEQKEWKVNSPEHSTPERDTWSLIWEVQRNFNLITII